MILYHHHYSTLSYYLHCNKHLWLQKGCDAFPKVVQIISLQTPHSFSYFLIFSNLEVLNSFACRLNSIHNHH
jgi:hypothetical protein